MHTNMILLNTFFRQVENFTVSFADGRALCALLHHYHPALLPWRRDKGTYCRFAILYLNGDPVGIIKADGRLTSLTTETKIRGTKEGLVEISKTWIVIFYSRFVKSIK